MVDAESTPLPCGPPAIQFTLSITIVSLQIIFLSFSVGLPAASCLIDAYTTYAFSFFSTVWAYTITIVDKISAVYATRLIFF
jgi:hypothetical protein